MKSPLTGKEMERRMEPGVKITYRKEEFTIVHHYWLCTDSGEQFTDEAMDDLDLGQVHNQYREKYGIPFPEEIKSIREKYGVSASKMSEILGFGANSWRQYEAGEIPSVSNGRLILAIRHPADFIRQVEASAGLLTEKESAAFVLHARKLLHAQEEKWKRKTEEGTVQVFTKHRPSQFTGYKVPDLKKAAQMVLYFGQQMPQLWKTKLNKLLFYTDFLHFNRFGISISGMEYRAIQHGPVPAQYDKLLLHLAEAQCIETEETESGNGIFGEVVKPLKSFDPAGFSATEIQMLEQVSTRFQHLSARQLVDLSHKEKGWKACIEKKELIGYREFGFEITLE